uniref:Immunoglobulin V-set domain-containing protein n=1 Tax=Salvator merianae TaxID=96440 RepID=A0A8D0DLZ9_SALMN
IEVPMQSTRRGLGRLSLLLFSILVSCFLLSQAQGNTIPITLDPLVPKQGQNVTLTPKGMPAGMFSCNWFRGAKTDMNQLIITYYPSAPNKSVKGLAYTGHEAVDANCSLLISNFSRTYSGNYTILWYAPGIVQTGNVYFTENLLPCKVFILLIGFRTVLSSRHTTFCIAKLGVWRGQAHSFFND